MIKPIKTWTDTKPVNPIAENAHMLERRTGVVYSRYYLEIVAKYGGQRLEDENRVATHHNRWTGRQHKQSADLILHFNEIDRRSESVPAEYEFYKLDIGPHLIPAVRGVGVTQYMFDIREKKEDPPVVFYEPDLQWGPNNPKTGEPSLLNSIHYCAANFEEFIEGLEPWVDTD